jgi:hypothetical protein
VALAVLAFVFLTQPSGAAILVIAAVLLVVLALSSSSDGRRTRRSSGSGDAGPQCRFPHCGSDRMPDCRRQSVAEAPGLGGHRRS